MKSILLIAPQKDIEKKAREITKHSSDIEIRQARTYDAIDLVDNIESNGIEAIISRGETSRIIREAVESIPIIDIKVSPYDILKSITSAKKYGKNICVLGYNTVIEGIDLFNEVLDINLSIYNINDWESIEKCVESLLRPGQKIDSLIGGSTAEYFARKYNIPTVSIVTGYDAISYSIEEARKIVEVKRNEKKKTELFETVLNNIEEGVISVNEKKEVITLNPAAERLLGINPKIQPFKKLSQIIKKDKLTKIIDSKELELGKIIDIKDKKLIVNKVPIIINNIETGSVATFQDITKIQEYEQRIREKIKEKGFIAKYSFEDIIGNSKYIVETKKEAIKYSETESTVLITGESGTGKEIFAQSIHNNSKRKKGPFVAVNCASISQSLIESELFGYEEGAFTGAKKQGKRGLFSEAHKGTIFLDEVCEIPIDVQTRLLRVIQEREIRPVGSNRVIPIDVRIIAATNKKLINEIEKGNFREDLYYRLDILSLNIPSLKDRKKDIELLSKYFVEKISKKYQKTISITKEALEFLEIYTWPGNVRELENSIEKLVVLNQGVIDLKEVEDLINNKIKKNKVNYDKKDLKTLEEVKNNYIKKVLEICDDNQTLAAKKLGISRTHLWRILNK